MAETGTPGKKAEKKVVAVITSNARTLLTFRFDFLLALKATGAAVTALAPEDDHFKKVQKALKQHGISLESIPLDNTGLNPLQDLRTIQCLKQRLAKIQATHVFSYTLKPVVYGAIAARSLNIPHVTAMMTGLGHLYTFDDLRTKVLRFVADRLLKIAFKRTQKVFFQNKDDAKVLMDRHLLHPDQVALVNGSGVNLKTFPVSPLNPETPLTFLFVGRLLRSKGFYEYCEAVKMVHKKYPGMRYQLIGGFHSNPAKLEKDEALKLMVESGVHYLGEVDEVLPYLREAHVVVLPSYREGTPKALLEALSVGRPLITTNAPGCCETVIDHKNGLLVNVGDPWAIAEAMRFFIQHPENLKHMAKASRQLAEEKFDVRKVNKALLTGMGL